jgi:hypothetical protein
MPILIIFGGIGALLIAGALIEFAVIISPIWAKPLKSKAAQEAARRV